jgi:hypothetical protein
MPPRPRDKKQTKNFRPIKIYLDELYEIEQLLLQHGADIKLSTDKTDYDTVQEIVDHIGEATPTITELTIISNSHPPIILNLHPNTISLEVGSSDVASTGIFYKLSAILNKCQVSSNIIMSLFFIGSLHLLVAANVISYYSFTGLGVKAFLAPTVAGIMLVYVTFSFVRWYLRINSPKHSQIVLKKRHEDKSFWQKNKGDIFKGIIIAVVSSLLTLLLRSLIEQ